jgi:hypothetical protein
VVDWCCMCNKSWESIDHLFLQCEENYGVHFSICFGLHGVTPLSHIGKMKNGTYRMSDL